MALYESLNAQSTPEQIAAAYNEFAGGAGGDTTANKEAAASYLTNLGISAPTIESAYQNYLNPASTQTAATDPLYKSLTAQSTPDQIAAAYNQFTGMAGGNTQQAQTDAVNYLSNLGVAAPTVQSAYNQYLGDYASGIANKVSNAFGSVTGGAPTSTGILSGFEALNRGDFTEDQARRLLGTGTFDKYQSMFGGEIKKGLGEMLADKNLSGQEAIDAIQFARKYGIDANEFASLTGYKPEMYNAIQKGYDTTVNSLVNKSLEGVTNLGDRIKTGLALESKYGFTDEDLSKATGMKADEIKSYLDPVRNFGDEYKKVVGAADASGKDILSFLENAKKDQAVNSVYGSNLDAMQQKLNELNDKWAGYKVDGYQAENIYNQINQITNAAGGKNWSGSWAGGGDQAAKEATMKLMQKGVDNLSDLKVVPAYEKSTVNSELYQGLPVRTDENGGKYVVEGGWDGGGAVKYLSADAQTTPAKASYDGEGNVTGYKPLTEAELKTYNPKTGEYQAAAGNNLIDSSTGKVISKSDGNKFLIDNYSSGNFLKSTDKEMGIMMTDSGVPVPYQTSSSSGLITSPMFPILASVLLPGIGSALSGALAGTVGTGVANAALTQGIMSGGLSALTGGDVGKGFLSGAITAPVSAGISSLMPSGMDPNLSKFATNLGTNLATGAITGNPVNLQNSLINAGVQYGASQLPFNLTPQQVNLLAGIATPLLQGQSIDPTRLGGILANYAIKSQAQAGAKNG